MMTLTLLSFTNMLLVRDLDPENWPVTSQKSMLLSHPLVKQVFEGRPSDGDAQYATEYPIDEHAKADLPLIYDADSSQHSALIDVLEEGIESSKALRELANHRPSPTSSPRRCKPARRSSSWPRSLPHSKS